MDSVVLPTPPFWLEMAMLITRMMDVLLPEEGRWLRLSQLMNSGSLFLGFTESEKTKMRAGFRKA